MLDVIDAAHPLPSKDKDKPILHVRIKSKLIRALILDNKKEYFKSSTVKFGIQEDICKPYLDLLLATRKRSDVLFAYYSNYKVKYKTKDSDKIHTASL